MECRSRGAWRIGRRPGVSRPVHSVPRPSGTRSHVYSLRVRAEYRRGRACHRAGWCPRAARRLAVRGAASRQSRARRPGAHSRSSASQGRHRGRSCDPRGSAAAEPEALVDDPPGSRPLRPRGAAQRSDRGRVARIRPRPAPAPATGVGRRSPALAVRGCARREVELGLIARIADPVSTSCRGRSSRADCGKASWHRGAGIGSTRSPMTGRCRVWKMTGGSESALGAAIKLATWRVGGGEAR